MILFVSRSRYLAIADLVEAAANGLGIREIASALNNGEGLLLVGRMAGGRPTSPAALAFGALRESPGGPVDCRGRRGQVVLHPRTKPVRHQPYSTHSMSVQSTSELMRNRISVQAFEGERRRVSLQRVRAYAPGMTATPNPRTARQYRDLGWGVTAS
ncbi:hypothetical protein AMK12_37425 [Streptomyces sp. TSRI0395]|nr:hypothetical protein AMK12_37425 [Streptomyces sp. TSRI0395]